MAFQKPYLVNATFTFSASILFSSFALQIPLSYLENIEYQQNGHNLTEMDRF